MNEPENPSRLSSDAARPSSIRSVQRQQSSSPSSQLQDPDTRQRSRLPSTETVPSPPELPDESTLKARQPPKFQPLFTLVSDNTPRPAAQTHHPHVHYLFADDDPDILTQALAAQPSSPTEDSAGAVAAERTILLDLVPRADGGGYDVAWASSLSPDWAVTAARVSRMEGETSQSMRDAGADDGTLMLRIEGVSVEGPAAAAGPRAKTPSPEGESQLSGGSGNRLPTEEYSPLIEEFEKRMSILRKVVDTSEDRRRKIAADQAAEDEDTQRAVEQVEASKEDGGGD